MKDSYLITQIGFVSTTVIFYGLLLQQLKLSLRQTSFVESRKKRIFDVTLLSVSGWGLFTAALSVQNFFNDFNTFPPRFFIVIIIPLIAISAITRTKTMREILAHTSQGAIIRLQTFRIIVELLLWHLYVNRLAPIQMTFEGRNFDVLSGLSAIFIAYLAHRKKLTKTIGIIWNLCSIVLLLNIVVTALLSLPTPFRQFMNDPDSTIVTKFPIIWLPALLVPLAYGLHFLSLRKFMMNENSRP